MRRLAAALLASFLASFSQMAVDDTHQQVFIAGGLDTVEVRGFDGSLKGTVTGQSGATSVAVAPDDSAVYVALYTAGAVSRIDPVTLTETGRYAVGPAAKSVAFAGSRLFVSHTVPGSVVVSEIDLTTNPPTVGAPFPTPWGSIPLLAGDATGSHLVALEDSLTPGKVTSLDLSLSPPTAVTRSGLDAPGDNCGDVAVDQTADEAVVACAVPSVHHAYRTSDLGLAFSYATTGFPNAVAAGPAGVAVGVASSGVHRADVFVFPRHSSTSVHTVDVDPAGGTQWTLAPRGLALSGDGTRLFVVSSASSALGTTWRFLVVADPFSPAPSAPYLTVSAPAKAPRAVALTVTGSLTDVPVLPAGIPLTVSRSDASGTRALPGTTTDAAGAFTVHDTPVVGGANTYTVSYSGDAQHLATSASVTVAVSRATPVLTVTSDASTYDYKRTATVTAHLGTTFNGRTVAIYAAPIGQSKVLVGTGTVDASGNLTVKRVVARRTTFSVVFPGDFRYAPRTVTSTVRVRAAVAERLSGQYATSRGVPLFHRTVDPLLSVTVSPNHAGECIRFRAERFSAGAWRLWATSECAISLDASSRAAASLTGSHPTGTTFRIRAEYLGDTVSAAKNGPWKSFRFT